MLIPVKSSEIKTSPENVEVGIIFSEPLPVLASEPLKILEVVRTSLPVQLVMNAISVTVEKADSKLSFAGKLLICEHTNVGIASSNTIHVSFMLCLGNLK